MREGGDARRRGWRGAALGLGALALIAVCWAGLSASLAGARAVAYPAPRVDIQLSAASTHPRANQVFFFSVRRLAGTDLSFLWDFGDNATAAGGLRQQHAYTAPGHYIVTVSASDPLGQWAVATAPVTVYPPPPVATFQWFPGNISAAIEINFSADLLHGSATFRWTFGDGTLGQGQRLAHFYAHPGTYTVTLTVTDTYDQTTSSTQRLRVPVSLLFAYFTETPQAGAPQTMLFDASASAGPISRYLWYFGDGTNAVVGGLFERHDYAEPGTYTVTLNVTDGSGGAATYSQTITVT